MNREILFRGQTRKKGEKVKNFRGDPMPSEWVYGGIFPQNKGGDFSIIYTYEPIDKRIVYADTVDQYTGLHDNTHWDDLSEKEKEDWLKHHTKDEWKGKRIFNRDIVRVYLENSEPFPTLFVVKIGRYLDVDTGDYAIGVYLDGGKVQINILSGEGNTFKKVGNIHDNPELLEVE